LDSAKSLLSSYTITQAGTYPAFSTTPTTASTWFKSRADGVRPPSGSLARYVRVVVQTSGTFVPVLIDSVYAYQTARELNISQFHQTPYAAGGGAGLWYPIPMLETNIAYPTLAGGLNRYDWGNNLFVTRSSGTSPGANNTSVWLTGEVLGNAMGDGFLAREDGTYQFTINALIQANASSRYGVTRLVRNATYDPTNNNNTGGTVLMQSNTIPVQARALFANAAFGAGFKTHGALTMMKGDFQLQRFDRVSLEYYRLNSDVDWGAFAVNSGLNAFWVKQKFTE
jgi:hypothetical protein